MPWSTGGIFDRKKVSNTGARKVQTRDNVNKRTSEQANYDNVLEKIADQHNAQLANLEDKWKTKIKQVLRIANEKVALAEEELQNQQKQNETLVKSIISLKKIIGNMKENQRILQERNNSPEELKIISTELAGLRELMIKHEELILSTRKLNINISKDMSNILLEKEKFRLETMKKQQEESVRTVGIMERELVIKQQLIDIFQTKIRQMEQCRLNSVWKGEMVDLILGLTVIVMTLGYWKWISPR